MDESLFHVGLPLDFVADGIVCRVPVAEVRKLFIEVVIRIVVVTGDAFPDRQQLIN